MFIRLHTVRFVLIACILMPLAVYWLFPDGPSSKYVLADYLKLNDNVYVLYYTFVVSLCLAWILTKTSHRFFLMDTPNHRSVHTQPIARSGGIAITLSFFIGIYLLGTPFPLYMVFAILLVFGVGLLDDIKHVGSKSKFAIIFFAATLLYINGFYIDSIGTWLGYEITLGWFALPFLWFVMSGFTNGVNLIDGLDGLAASVSIIILLALGYIGFKYDDLFLYYSSFILAFSILGFLILNWHPASIFMGDSGSLTIGFIISILAIHALQYINPVSILLLAALPILDALVVMFRRIAHGKSPFEADKTHIHHIILRLKGGNVRLAVLLMITMQFLFTIIGLGFKIRDQFIILLVFALIVFVFYHLLTPSRRRK